MNKHEKIAIAVGIIAVLMMFFGIALHSAITL